MASLGINIQNLDCSIRAEVIEKDIFDLKQLIYL